MLPREGKLKLTLNANGTQKVLPSVYVQRSDCLLVRSYYHKKSKKISANLELTTQSSADCI